MAEIDLGKISFTFKGVYAAGTTYESKDVVQYTDGALTSTFVYVNATAAAGQTPSTGGTVNTTYWQYMAKGGVAGNDFGLSNNQIAVKNNSGTLTGVSIGTAGQALKVNSGANGYEFGTISSDYEKVASGTITNTQNWDFASSNFDGSTYKYFDFHIEVQHHSGTQSGAGELRFQQSGSNIGSSTTSANGVEMNSSSGSVNAMERDGSDSSIFMNDGFRNSKGYLKMTWMGLNRAVHKCCFHEFIRPNHDGSTRTRWTNGAMFVNNTTSTNNGIRLQFPGSATGDYVIYGRKV